MTPSTLQPTEHSDEYAGSTERRILSTERESPTSRDVQWRRECELDDWLPALVQAAEWNKWTKDELLIQLAGHLKGRARQEWSLLSESDKTNYDKSVEALCARLDL